MKQYIYQLKIRCKSKDQLDLVSDILDTKPNRHDEEAVWWFEIEQGEDEPYRDFVSLFLGILSGKYESLARLGIFKSDISIFYIYHYHEQCNMEFPSDMLKVLGAHGITFCISCWSVD